MPLWGRPAGAGDGTQDAVHGRVNNYQDLVVWQVADQLRTEIYRLLKTGSAARDFQFANQLRRSVSGIAPNIAEGFRRYGPKEFVRYLDFAFGSAGETADWLDVGIARGHWSETDLVAARTLLRRLNVGLTRLMKYLRSPAAKANAGR